MTAKLKGQDLRVVLATACVARVYVNVVDVRGQTLYSGARVWARPVLTEESGRLCTGKLCSQVFLHL